MPASFKRGESVRGDRAFIESGRDDSDANITEREAMTQNAAEQSLREGGQEIAVEQNLRENHLVAAIGWAVL